jgi:hypothetical protein
VRLLEGAALKRPDVIKERGAPVGGTRRPQRPGPAFPGDPDLIRDCLHLKLAHTHVLKPTTAPPPPSFPRPIAVTPHLWHPTSIPHPHPPAPTPTPTRDRVQPLLRQLCSGVLDSDLPAAVGGLLAASPNVRGSLGDGAGVAVSWVAKGAAHPPASCQHVRLSWPKGARGAPRCCLASAQGDPTGQTVGGHP